MRGSWDLPASQPGWVTDKPPPSHRPDPQNHIPHEVRGENGQFSHRQTIRAEGAPHVHTPACPAPWPPPNSPMPKQAGVLTPSPATHSLFPPSPAWTPSPHRAVSSRQRSQCCPHPPTLISCHGPRHRVGHRGPEPSLPGRRSAQGALYRGRGLKHELDLNLNPNSKLSTCPDSNLTAEQGP